MASARGNDRTRHQLAKSPPGKPGGLFRACIYPTCLRRVCLQFAYGIFAADERAACASRQEAHESLVVEMEWLEDRWRCACQTKAVYRGLLAQIRAKDSCALSAFSYLWICLFTLQSKSGTCGDSLQGLKTGRVAWRTRLALFYCRISDLGFGSLISGSDLGSWLSRRNPHAATLTSQPPISVLTSRLACLTPVAKAPCPPPGLPVHAARQSSCRSRPGVVTRRRCSSVPAGWR